MPVLGLLHAAQAGHHTQCFNEISTVAPLMAAMFVYFHERVLADASYDCICITLSYSWPSGKCHPCPPPKQSLPSVQQHLSLTGHKWMFLHTAPWNLPPLFSLALCRFHYPFLYPNMCHNKFHQHTFICASVSKHNIKKNQFHDTHPKGMNWPGGCHC